MRYLPSENLKFCFCYLKKKFMFKATFWRGARVVESGGLENRCGGNSTEGSNPSLSASFDDED